MTTRRTILKVVAAAIGGGTIGAAIGGTIGAALWPHKTEAKGTAPFKEIAQWGRFAATLADNPPPYRIWMGDTLHLNALHHPRPTVPHIVCDYGNGNVWYSLTSESAKAMELIRYQANDLGYPDWITLPEPRPV